MSLITRVNRRIRGLASRSGAPEAGDLDLAFYRMHYADLAGLSDADLLAHFASAGRSEGRHSNSGAYISTLSERLGALPAGFDPVTYARLHRDVGKAFSYAWQYEAHYLEHGRREGRAYDEFDVELYRSLHFPETVITDYELNLDFINRGRPQKLVASWAGLLAPHGMSSAWVSLLKVDEFELLNWSWAGATATRADAVRKMVEEGVGRLAPISFALAFDPAYYRETHPSLAARDDAALYRRWLDVGVAEGEPASPTQALSRLGLPLAAFPEGFDWRSVRPGAGLRSDRWTALEALVRDGLAKGAPLPVVAGADAGAFLFALGFIMRGRDDALAVRCFRALRDLGDCSFAAAHHLADALLRQGRPAQAVSLFREASVKPDAEVWTFVNGSKAARTMGAFAAAIDFLRRSRADFGGEVAWRDEVRETIEALFAARRRRIRPLYALGGRAKADAHILRLIARVEALWEELDPIGAPLPATKPARTVMLANYDLAVCTHYRIDQKRELFDHLGRPIEIFSADRIDEFISALPGASAAIFFRLIAWPGVVRAISAARAFGVPTYYEMDDLTFDAEEYPDALESYGGLITPAHYQDLQFGVPMTRAAIQMCDYAISSTLPLAKALQPLVRTGEVFWLPNGLDSRNDRYLDAPPERVRQGDEVIIAYASGTTAHNSDFHELATPAIIETLRQDSNARFLLVGYLALTPEYDEVRDQIIRLDYVNGSAAFWSLLADADINIAVLKSTWATDSKSEIKWLEAAVMGIPSVVSETAMYRGVLEDGVDALIARTPDDWRQALGALVADAGLRRRVGEAARAKAERQYSIAANAQRVEALLTPALERRSQRPRPAASPAKARILLANVWFPPQTIGGATRVLRNNLDAWLDAGEGAEFDFLVAATDAGVSPPYRRRVDTYRGVPVTRISTPMQMHMDWRPEDPAVGAWFAELIESWKPDLIHFHAVQRLTASVVEAARLAGVPYLCTPHDAWWLSDWHFLTDDEGRAHSPCEDLPRHPPQGISVSQSLDRRRVLKRALAGAQRVLPVSESFADIYRACGVAKVQAAPNGLPPLPPATRRPSTGRVRLAHVGNVAKHKGFHLLQAALRQGRFANLELEVIDHARASGSSISETWGSTPVRIVGKWPQDHIQELYARTDVLVAPSTWPESFGLVAREALSCGCWVVAGDMGAMSEDVIPGQNGFVVDVSTPEGLIAALAEIDADPARYTTPPTPTTALRTAEHQAQELMAIYREVLEPRAARALAG